MTRPVNRVDYELAYCAWVLIAPTWVAKYPRPPLAPWVACFVDVVLSGVRPAAGDRSGQHYRRAIIAGATPEQPFPGEIRGKAILVEARVRQFPAERLAALGSPADIVRALGPAVQLVPASRSA